jgi:RNA polymerase sigma-70 factor (ECF subfamily)
LTDMNGKITAILNRASHGEAGAVADLLPLVYAELRQLASGYLRSERTGHTLQPTALVHEAYMRLVGDNRDWKSRAHFLAASATAMRRILVDHARSRKAAKRGGGNARVPLTENLAADEQQDIQLLELDEILEKLRRLSDRKARIVELRFFAGMTIPEVAEALGVSKTVVDDDWAVARAWLAVQIRDKENRT